MLRAQIELYARWMEEERRLARATLGGALVRLYEAHGFGQLAAAQTWWGTEVVMVRPRRSPVVDNEAAAIPTGLSLAGLGRPPPGSEGVDPVPGARRSIAPWAAMASFDAQARGQAPQ